jgi:anaerobic magnesium-protoporphyrin IX monomethyl ester cyclase
LTAVNATLIGFHDQGNLGLGYLGATLSKYGFKVTILDFRLGNEVILESVRSNTPLLIGFSLIFQYYLPEFMRLAAFLRESGVKSHFCIGGHFPTLRYQQLLEAVPELDTVVRCEGELTLLELMQRLAIGHDWRDVEGIAYCEGDQCVATPPRRLIEKLDDLPDPLRPNESLAVLGKMASPILASRGCARHCAFCSIRQFYRQAPGKQVRVRSPDEVVREMRTLYEQRHVSIFLFQDDDFPLWGDFGRHWVERFMKALETNDLLGRVIWKISCRADEVKPELFNRMRAAGLYMVYLGLESGTESGLRTLNKQLTVADNLRAVAILKDLDLAIAYGFMLFDPSSTFQSLQTNVAFLRQIGEDGLLPVVACRMLPYAGTSIEESLAQEGRLRGNFINPDYDFPDPRLNDYFEVLNAFIAHFVQGPDALSNQLNWAWQEYWVIQRLFPPLEGIGEYERFLRLQTERSNSFLLSLIQGSSMAYASGRDALPPLADFKKTCYGFSERLIMQRDEFMLKNQKKLLDTLDLDDESHFADLRNR